jgi:hypothetical protein
MRKEVKQAGKQRVRLEVGHKNTTGAPRESIDAEANASFGTDGASEKITTTRQKQHDITHRTALLDTTQKPMGCET